MEQIVLAARGMQSGGRLKKKTDNLDHRERGGRLEARGET